MLGLFCFCLQLVDILQEFEKIVKELRMGVIFISEEVYQFCGERGAVEGKEGAGQICEAGLLLEFGEGCKFFRGWQGEDDAAISKGIDLAVEG